MDSLHCAAALAWVYEETGDQRYADLLATMMGHMKTYPRNSDGSFYHFAKHQLGTQTFWVDGVYMGQVPSLRYANTGLGDSQFYYDEAARQIRLIFDRCRKPDSKGLILHAWDETKTREWADPETGLSPEVWCEGLGWYTLILPEAVEFLPADHPEREQIITQYRLLLEDLKEHQCKETGLWYQIVDKGHLPDNWHDTSGSAMFTYSIQRAIELGIVSADEYADVAQRGYEGVLSKLGEDESGFLVLDACQGLGVQNNYKAYVNYKRRTNAKEAVGAVLWALVIMNHEQPADAE